MQQAMMYPPAVPEWAFAPSWDNPRVRRLVAAMMATQIAMIPLLFIVYQSVLGYGRLHALIFVFVYTIIVVIITLTSALPTKRQMLINPFGIYYRSSSTYSVRAIWADVESIERYRWLWFPTEEGIFLSKRAAMSNPLVRIYGKWSRFVPLSLFDPDWRNGAIGALLRQYDPALFESASHDG